MRCKLDAVLCCSINVFFRFLACSIGDLVYLPDFGQRRCGSGYMLPTKGLTLPLISYGGSSLIIMSTAIVMLLRIDYESRLAQAQAFVRSPK